MLQLHCGELWAGVLFYEVLHKTADWTLQTQCNRVECMIIKAIDTALMSDVYDVVSPSLA
jgi:hypothetical protein